MTLDPKPARAVGKKPTPPKATTPAYIPGTHPRLQRRPPHRLFRLHRQPALPPARRPRTFPGAESALPWLDEQANLAKGEELLRDPGDGVPDRRALAWE